MSLPENPHNPEFSSRGLFHKRLNQTVNNLFDLEAVWNQRNIGVSQRLLSFSALKNHFDLDNQRPGNELGLAEEVLFHQIFDLFSFKHQLTETDKTLAGVQQQDRIGRNIGFLGPLGAAKTTTAKAIAKDFKVGLATVEPHENNRFWVAQQNDPDKYAEFMLRSQVFFFVSNLNSDIKADIMSRTTNRTNISDTSILTDVMMWVEWYHQTGRFDEEEYQSYKSLVELFKPIIPQPDMLVVMNADSSANLVTGVENRRKDNPSRKGEIFTESELALQMEITDQLSEEFAALGVPTLKMIINPVEAWQDPYISYDIIYQLRSRLGLLGEFLGPKPDEVVSQVVQILLPAGVGKVVVIHSKSMFSGKTTAECLLAKKVGKDKVVAFQPRASLRTNESKFQGQETAIVSRDDLRIDAITVENNNLKSILEYIEKKRIKPKDKPYIFIDEIMLFVGHEGVPKEAINVLEELRSMGFHLVVAGVDRTFNELPFTFMYGLLEKTLTDENWFEIETKTRCRYCDRDAEVTRLTLIDERGVRVFAPDNYNWEHPGDSDFDPVCGTVHQSCTHTDFGPYKIKKLPTEH